LFHVDIEIVRDFNNMREVQEWKYLKKIYMLMMRI
jgi:hypothetical protein